MNYTEHTASLEITGNEDSFLGALRWILRKRRVQKITITSTAITYTRLLAEGEPEQSETFSPESLTPYAAIRNSVIAELPERMDAAIAIASQFAEATRDQLNPIAFVMGANSSFWEWHKTTTGIDLRSDRPEMYGLSVLSDRMVSDDVLILCAGYTTDRILLETIKSYKILIPQTMSTHQNSLELP